MLGSGSGMVNALHQRSIPNNVMYMYNIPFCQEGGCDARLDVKSESTSQMISESTIIMMEDVFSIVPIFLDSHTLLQTL